MKGIPDNSIDLILTDPPYGAMKGFSNDTPSKIQNNIKQWSKTIKSKTETTLIFCYYLNIRYWLNEFNDWQLLNILTWHKELGANNSRSFSQKSEYILWFTKNNQYIFNPPQVLCTSNRCFGQYKTMTDLFLIPFNNMDNERVDHPTQKPLKLINILINATSHEKHIILDPFLGSGTTAIACKQLNRRFIGIEINPDYCKIARERLMAVPDNLPFE